MNIVKNRTKAGDLTINRKNLSKALEKSNNYKDTELNSMIEKLYKTEYRGDTVEEMMVYLKNDHKNQIRLLQVLMCMCDLSLGEAMNTYSL